MHFIASLMFSLNLMTEIQIPNEFTKNEILNINGPLSGELINLKGFIY